MIRINLIPAEEVQHKAGKRQQAAIGVLVLGCAVVLLVGLHGWQQLAIMSVHHKQARLEREIAELKGPYEAVVQMERQKKELQEKLAVIRDLEAKKVGPVRMLADLSDATPDKLWLTEFIETNGSAHISGLGVDEQTIADFLRRLAESPYFVGVDLDETSQVEADGLKHKRFVIRTGIDYAAARKAADASKTAAAPKAKPADQVAMASKPQGGSR
jgi:type IV pilus assembly protein PilN